MATKHPSHGTQIGVDFAGGTSYTDIGSIEGDIQIVSLTAGVITVTTHDDDWVTKLRGIPDPGQLTFRILFDPATAVHEDFVTEFDGDPCTLPAWQVTMEVCTSVVTSAVWTFDGFVQSFTLVSPNEGVHGADVTIEISGQPNLTIVTP